MILPQAPFHENSLNTTGIRFFLLNSGIARVKLNKRISIDVPSKMSFTHKSALRLPTAPCPFQDLAGTLIVATSLLFLAINKFTCHYVVLMHLFPLYIPGSRLKHLQNS